MSDDIAIQEEEETWQVKLPPWNPHLLLHKKCDPGECRECAINAAHAQRCNDAVAEYGGSIYDVPVAEWARLSTIHHGDWIEFYRGRGGDVDITRHDKTSKLFAFVNDDANVNKEFTAQQLADVAEASLSTAQEFIRTNRWRFRKVATGVYAIVDMAEARARDAALAAATLAAAARTDDAAPTAPNPVALIAPPKYGGPAKL